MKNMTRLLLVSATLACATSFLAITASADMLGEPGFYGAIEVGHGPIPQLVYPQPAWVRPTPYGAMPPPPLYLHVPPRVFNHWPRFCMQYGACGRPVYFVTNAWYQQMYIPYYRAHPEFWHREGHPEGEWRGREGGWRGRDGEGRDHEHH
ncbi:MAG: hypothetical protein G3I09_01545 [Ferrovum sp.]|nr:hypothetical protein [Ferrovum sp.]